MLVDYWDLDSESFRLDDMSLTIEVEDIYFITGLSWRGEMVNLRAQGGARSWDDYRRVHSCVLLPRDGEGGEPSSHQRYTGARPKGHTIQHWVG